LIGIRIKPSGMSLQRQSCICSTRPPDLIGSRKRALLSSAGSLMRLTWTTRPQGSSQSPAETGDALPPRFKKLATRLGFVASLSSFALSDGTSRIIAFRICTDESRVKLIAQPSFLCLLFKDSLAAQTACYQTLPLVGFLLLGTPLCSAKRSTLLQARLRLPS
jgi:hypothetical protein